MRVGEPFRALVVKVGERALLQDGLGGIGRIEPRIAQTDEVAGGVGDGCMIGRNWR